MFGTFAVVALSSACFSCKGVFAKCAYRLGADAMTVLGLRMLFALPFFLLGGWLIRQPGRIKLTRKDWFQLTLLGFLGYYLSSLVNFIGLQFVSAGLERIVLYTYPSMVVIGGVVFQGQRLSRAMVLAAVAAYLGIIIAFVGEAHARSEELHELIIGVALVFGSALSYATFILLSLPVVRRVGSNRFTAIVSSISGIMILTHYAIARPIPALFQQSSGIYGWAILVAIVGTVLPSYLLGIGLRRAGAQKFAIIGSIGPVVTLFLAWALLGETLGPAQAIGFALTLCGGLAVSLTKEPSGPRNNT